MRDHAFVHSCFGILSSFEFRISSFPRSLRTINYQPTTINCSGPGLTRDPAGPNGTPSGPIGISFRVIRSKAGVCFNLIDDNHLHSCLSQKQSCC